MHPLCFWCQILSLRSPNLYIDLKPFLPSLSPFGLSECFHVVFDCSCKGFKGTKYSNSRQNWRCSTINQKETLFTRLLLLLLIKEVQEYYLLLSPIHTCSLSQQCSSIFPRKCRIWTVAKTEFTGTWHQWFPTLRTVEGIYWELWCEWKHGYYWKAWGALAARAFFFNTFISTQPPTSH